MSSTDDFSSLSRLLTELLRMPASAGGIRNALQHMWGYVSNSFSGSNRAIETWSLKKLLNETQRGALTSKEPYLMASTALSELKVWLKNT